MLYLLILFVQVHCSCKEVFNCGHSSRVTPGLIPNPEVKPAHVGCGTQIREFSGNIQRCNCLRLAWSFCDCFVIVWRKSGYSRDCFSSVIFSYQRAPSTCPPVTVDNPCATLFVRRGLCMTLHDVTRSISVWINSQLWKQIAADHLFWNPA